MIKHEDVRKDLHYEQESGILTNTLNGKVRGGYADSFKYGRVYYQGKVYLLHRFIYFWMTGEWPEFVDHIDGDPWNNKWDNLRSVSRSENQRNTKLRTDNKSGVSGVCYGKRDNVWIARIGKRKLGTFKTKEEAIAAREADPEFETFTKRHGT